MADLQLVLGVFAALLGACAFTGELRVWWRLRFRSPRYLLVAVGATALVGAALATLESFDEARPGAIAVFLFGLPVLAVSGFLLYGGPSEYVRLTPLLQYPNGIRAGSSLRLRSALPLHDHDGRPTGQVLAAGEIWQTLPGSILEPDVVWLKQPDGELHTWDSVSLLDYFELTDAAAA
ncbi:MAG: hypothetical protein AAF430_18500 [Myxococcota bacterium]